MPSRHIQDTFKRYSRHIHLTFKTYPTHVRNTPNTRSKHTQHTFNPPPCLIQDILHTFQHTFRTYGVAWISRLLKTIGLLAKEPHKRDYILQKRPIDSRSLLFVATPYSKNIQHTFKTHPTHIQDTSMPHSRHIQDTFKHTFKTYSRHLHHTFKKHPTHIQHASKTHSKHI